MDISENRGGIYTISILHSFCCWAGSSASRQMANKKYKPDLEIRRTIQPEILLLRHHIKT